MTNMGKNQFIIMVTLFLAFGIFSANAKDLIILKNGNIIESKIMEISETEIRYKKIDHLDGPNIVLSVEKVLSIRYENGKVENLNSEQTVIQNNSDLIQFYDNELFHTLFYDKGSIPNILSGRRPLLTYQGQPVITGLNISTTANIAFSQYGETSHLSQSFQSKYKTGNILLWSGFGAYFGGYLIMMNSMMRYNPSTSDVGLYSSIGIMGLGVISMSVSPFVLISANKDLTRAVTAFNKQKISEFSNTPSILTQKQEYVKDSNSETPPKTIFGLSFNPANFIPTIGDGLRLSLDFTNNRFNALVDICSGFGLAIYGYDIFNIYAVFNYYHPSKIGGFYAGGFISTGLESINYDFKLGLGLNIGYKFITSSGMYFRTGGNVGYNILGNEFIIKPDVSVGYSF